MGKASSREIDVVPKGTRLSLPPGVTDMGPLVGSGQYQLETPYGAVRYPIPVTPGMDQISLVL
ncbi:MAG: hypothetical protein DWQ02_12045 [Bacteroidetes bacterium]|nr:MAG: hypothetical protein DWQ02_12045 [Bacteroidota bacterium]